LRYTRIHHLEINWTTPHNMHVDNWQDSYRSFGRKPAAELAGNSCSSGLSLVDHKQELVVASKDASDHKEWIASLQDDLDEHVQSDSSEAPCTGAVELAELNYQLSLLNMALITGISEE